MTNSRMGAAWRSNEGQVCLKFFCRSNVIFNATRELSWLSDWSTDSMRSRMSGT
jgi:hypothetical protein